MQGHEADGSGLIMRSAITMPALSDTMGAGKLVKWTRKPGDRISKGDLIAEVETDKAVMDVEAFQDGYLSGPLAADGTEAPVGQTIGYIADSLAEASGGGGPAAPAVDGGAGAPAAPAQAVPISPAPVSAVLAASMASLHPAARAPAPSRGAAASEQARSGSTAPDPVQAALDAGPPYRLESLSPMRDSMARNMIASATTPTFRVSAQFPITALKDTADRTQFSLTLLIARACARVVRAMPIFNAIYTPGGLARRDRVDIAIAVDLPDGLISPVLRDVAERPMRQIAGEWAALRAKVDSRRLKPGDYQGGTFYLSNLGMFGSVRSFDAVLPVGAAAILCVGSGRDGQACFTVVCDHRVVSGADGARFLDALGSELADPGKLST